MCQSVMKTVSGPSQLCYAKVIQTATYLLFLIQSTNRYNQTLKQSKCLKILYNPPPPTHHVSFPVPEILCGDPPTPPHTGQVWNGSSKPGSTVTYDCKKGFYHSEGKNVSLCTINGYWTEPNISCQGNYVLQDDVAAVVGVVLH